MAIGNRFSVFKHRTELLLKSRNVYPEKLVKSGFEFSFSTIETAFSDLIYQQKN
ncbi:DUF1731 domain-containing protein [Chryseobacterium camelliae]|uniref:DUF1731 domain-containing protein n=1 Tax=Chryseobacterium camelliae TaxID=1265445 RepID=UPI002FDCC473